MIPFEVIALSPYARELFAERGRPQRIHRFRDAQDRGIEIDQYRHEDWQSLVSMYGALDLSERGKSFPPLDPERRAVWLDQTLSRGPNLVARCDARIIGHVALLGYDRSGSPEVVVFVHRDYQRAGIGTKLVDTLLRRETPAAALWMSETASVLAKAGRGLIEAMRLVMIPLICAVVIAVVSESPRGRALAIVLAIAFVVFGVVARAGAIPRRRLPNVGSLR